MTYTRRYRRSRPKPVGMGGWFEDFMNQVMHKPSEEVQCIEQANAAVAPFDAKIDDLSKNWNPTGYYTPNEVRAQVTNVMNTVQAAQKALDQARVEPNASQDSIMRAVNDLARVGERSLLYLDAAREADEKGTRLVNAAGLKRWVVDSMAACSSGMVTAAVVGCIAPWWADTLASFQFYFDKAWAAAKALFGAILAIGETATLVANDLPELYRILKYSALVIIGYVAWERFIAKD